MSTVKVEIFLIINIINRSFRFIAPQMPWDTAFEQFQTQIHAKHLASPASSFTSFLLLVEEQKVSGDKKLHMFRKFTHISQPNIMKRRSCGEK